MQQVLKAIHWLSVILGCNQRAIKCILRCYITVGHAKPLITCLIMCIICFALTSLFVYRNPLSRFPTSLLPCEQGTIVQCWQRAVQCNQSFPLLMAPDNAVRNQCYNVGDSFLVSYCEKGQMCCLDVQQLMRRGRYKWLRSSDPCIEQEEGLSLLQFSLLHLRSPSTFQLVDIQTNVDTIYNFV